MINTGYHLLLRAIIISAMAFALSSCGKNHEKPGLTAEDSVAIVKDNLEHRIGAETFMREGPGSPFHRDSTIAFHGINWFPINPNFKVQSILHRYENPETVLVYGTKGEERRNLRYGYFEFDLPDEKGQAKRLRINVYKFTPYDAKRYALYRNNLSLWFTDKTTGSETYDVGRYIEMGDENPDPAFIYTIDFNKAFNPYCAYSDLFSCAIPRKDDRLDIALRVGEKKYHQ